MKCVRVVAALIIEECSVFAASRGYGEYRGFWEFPGGKIENGETPQEALKREIMEELDCLIEVGKKFTTVEFDYPSFHLSMDCFLCRLLKDKPVLKEALDSRWLSLNEFETVNWLPADRIVLDAIRNSHLLD